MSLSYILQLSSSTQLFDQSSSTFIYNTFPLAPILYFFIVIVQYYLYLIYLTSLENSHRTLFNSNTLLLCVDTITYLFTILYLASKAMTTAPL